MKLQRYIESVGLLQRPRILEKVQNGEDDASFAPIFKGFGFYSSFMVRQGGTGFAGAARSGGVAAGAVMALPI